jgi:hypothetical protein
MRTFLRSKQPAPRVVGEALYQGKTKSADLVVGEPVATAKTLKELFQLAENSPQKDGHGNERAFFLIREKDGQFELDEVDLAHRFGKPKEAAGDRILGLKINPTSQWETGDVALWHRVVRHYGWGETHEMYPAHVEKFPEGVSPTELFAMDDAYAQLMTVLNAVVEDGQILHDMDWPLSEIQSPEGLGLLHFYQKAVDSRPDSAAVQKLKDQVLGVLQLLGEKDTSAGVSRIADAAIGRFSRMEQPNMVLTSLREALRETRLLPVLKRLHDGLPEQDW